MSTQTELLALAEKIDDASVLLWTAGDGPHHPLSADEIEAIVTALRAHAQGAWQPIETAPKDGTRVLIAEHDVWMAVARYWPCNSYWIEDAASGMKLNPPTHWMPLPAPPAD